MTSFGEKNGAAVLNRKQVRRMRVLRFRGWTYSALAMVFGVDISTAWAAVNRRTWWWLL